MVLEKYMYRIYIYGVFRLMLFVGCMNGVGLVMIWNVNVVFLLKIISKIYI